MHSGMWQNPLPQGNTILNIQFINENIGWMMGDYGTILKTNDGGKNWTFLDSKTNNMIYSFQFISQDTGWACAYEGIILKTIDGGENWIRQDSGRAWFLNSICFVDKNKGWAVDASSQLFQTTNGGEYWTIQNFSGQYLNSIFFLNKDLGWICGSNRIFKTSDSGQSWTSFDISLRYGIKEVIFIDSLNGWGIGSFGSIAKTTDAGETWIEQLYTDADNFYSIKFNNHQDGFVVGSFGRIYFTTDSGNTWKLKKMKYDDQTLYDISIKNSNYFIVGESGVMYKSTDYGNSWTSLDVIGFNSFKDIQFINNKIGWMIGTSDSAVIYKTVDGGINWEVKYSYYGGIDALYFLDAVNGWVVGDWGFIYLTEDGGETWKKVPLPDYLWCNDIEMFSNGTGFMTAPSSAIAYKTTDFGRTWNRMTFPVSIDYGFHSLFFTDEKNGWIVSKEWLTQNHKILRTTNAGEIWQVEYEINTDYLWDIYFFDEKNGWIVGDNGIVLYTSDLGNNWTIIHNQIPAYFLSIYFLTPEIGYVSGTDIMKTTDAGYTWNYEKNNCTVGIKKIISPDGVKGIAIGRWGTLLNNKNIITTIEDENNFTQPEHFLLQQNYPNPFNPSTRIQYAISNLPTGQAGTQFVTLKVYDLLGREVATLVNEEKPAGSYNVEFNLESSIKYPSSGVFFYRLKAGNYVETKKMILLK